MVRSGRDSSSLIALARDQCGDTLAFLGMTVELAPTHVQLAGELGDIELGIGVPLVEQRAQPCLHGTVFVAEVAGVGAFAKDLARQREQDPVEVHVWRNRSGCRMHQRREEYPRGPHDVAGCEVHDGRRGEPARHGRQQRHDARRIRQVRDAREAGGIDGDERAPQHRRAPVERVDDHGSGCGGAACQSGGRNAAGGTPEHGAFADVMPPDAGPRGCAPALAARRV